MTWRKQTTEEIEELRQFVEGMKRGQTLATSDSLVETLRQIHDRREAPVAGHDHKRMLLERLRREMRVREGEAVEDVVPVPEFAPRPVRRRILQWAVAASLALHVGIGVAVLPNLELRGLFGGGDGYRIAEANEGPVQVTFLPLPPIPKVDPQPVPDARVKPTNIVSAEHQGRGEVAASAPAAAGPSAAPSVSSQPVGPPVAPGGAPIVPTYSADGLAGQADRGIADGGPSFSGPPPAAEPPQNNMSEVGAVSMSREDYDVAPRVLFQPKPKYTTLALQYQVKGKVRVSVLLAADGTIRDIQVIRSLGYGLDEEAIDAVRRIKFSPALRGGVPISVRTKIDVSFDLR